MMIHIASILEEFRAMLFIWLVHAIIAAVLSAPIVFFGRKRVHWHFWELLVLILPYTVWCLLFFSELARGKSMANFAEPFIFALAVPVAALVRVAISSRVPQRLCAGVLIATMCVVAAGVFFIVPPLPE